MIKFDKFTDKQDKIIGEPIARLTVLNGAVRSGKTFLTYFIIPLLISEFGTQSRGIIIGKTLGTVEENVLTPMRELFGDNVSDVKIDATGNRYVKIFGAKIRCIGANDKKSEGKIRGTTYAWAICDEVTLYPENVFDMLMSRLSEPNAKCICTTNPESPNHWFKRRYLDNNKIEIKSHTFTIDDNPTLNKEYVENLKNLYSGTELYDRLILGLWVSSNGAIYKKFIAEQERFVIDNIDKGEFADYSIGIDFGENKSATTFVLVGLKKNYKGIVVLEEEKITEHGDARLLQEQFIRFVKRCYINGWAPSNAYFDVAQWTLGRSLESAVRIAGLPIIVHECIKDEIKDRIHLTQILMGAYRFQVLSRCKEIVKAFKEAVWDESRKDKEVRLDIVNKDNPIDLLDAFEYAFQRWSSNLLKMTLYGG